MENVNENKKQKTLFYFLIIFLLLATVGYLAIEINSLNEKNKSLSEKSKYEKTKLEDERDKVMFDLEKMKFSYDTLMVSNDSLNLEFIEQKQQIESLLKKVKSKD